MSKTLSLAEAARAILTGKQLDEVVGSEPMKTFKTANGAEVVDHGKAITHPLDGQQPHGDADLKQDSSIPGATKTGEDSPISNPGSHTAKNGGAEGDKKGPGTLDGKGANADSSIPGAKGSKDPMGMKNPGSRVVDSPKTNPVKEEKEEKGDKKSAKDCDGDGDKDDKKPAFLNKEEKEAAAKAAMDEHMNALMEGENLPEEFKTKAKTIFEAAVNERVTALVEEKENEYVEKLEEAIKTLKEETEAKLQDYMSYLAQEWIKENKLAVDSSIKSNIMEDFVSGIVALCQEHNIDFPDAKIDVVEELTNAVEELEEKVNSLMAENIELNKKINTSSREKMVSEACNGLVDTQAAKLRKLAEGLTAENDEEFASKLKTLRESYTTNKPAVKQETLTEDKATLEHGAETRDLSPEIEKIVGILNRGSTNFNK